MEGGEDAESTTMVVEVVKGEWEGGGGQDDRQTDRQGVSAGTGIWGSDTHREAVLSGKYTDSQLSCGLVSHVLLFYTEVLMYHLDVHKLYRLVSLQVEAVICQHAPLIFLLR